MALLNWLKQVWTLACHSVLQAIRMKVVLIIVVFLVIIAVALPAILRSDGTQEGQIKLILTYYLYFVTVMLSVLTVFLSSATLNQEIKNQHILLLDPKPVGRGTVLVGKWLGVMIINAALLAIMLGVTYGFVKYFGRKLPGQPEDAHLVLRQNLLTAREAAQPPMPDVAKIVESHLEFLKRNNLMPPRKSEEWVRGQLTANTVKRAVSALPGRPVSWVIKGVPQLDETDWLTVRFRHHSSAASRDHEVLDLFVFVDRNGKKITEPFMRKFKVDAPHKFFVRPDVVGKDGTVRIQYVNLDPEVEVLFPAVGGLQLLYPKATMGENFVRVGAMIFFQLAFYAMVGIFASTFLSFPVAVLLTASVFFIAMMKDLIYVEFIPKVTVFGPDMAPPGTPQPFGDVLLRNVLAMFFAIFPGFGEYNTIPLISEGYCVPSVSGGFLGIFGGPSLLKCFVWVPLVRGGILALVGWYLFWRRELAVLAPTT